MALPLILIVSTSSCIATRCCYLFSQNTNSWSSRRSVIPAVYQHSVRLTSCACSCSLLMNRNARLCPVQLAVLPACPATASAVWLYPVQAKTCPDQSIAVGMQSRLQRAALGVVCSSSQSSRQRSRYCVAIGHDVFASLFCQLLRAMVDQLNNFAANGQVRHISNSSFYPTAGGEVMSVHGVFVCRSRKIDAASVQSDLLTGIADAVCQTAEHFSSDSDDITPFEPALWRVNEQARSFDAVYRCHAGG